MIATTTLISFLALLSLLALTKTVQSQIPSSLLSGTFIAPEGAPHGPPGSNIEEEQTPSPPPSTPTTTTTDQITTTQKTTIEAPSEEDVINRLLKNPGLPPAAPPDIDDASSPPSRTEDSGGELLKESLKEQQQQQKTPSPPSDETNAETASSISPSPSSTPAPPSTDSMVSRFQGENANAGAGGLPPSPPPSYAQCLQRIQAKICDPDGVLANAQRIEIDQILKELEEATRKDNTEDECNKSGLQVMVIVVRYSGMLNDDSSDIVQKRLSESLNDWVRDPDHRCEKPLILMMSADREVTNRKVWTGRSFAVPLDPSELVKLYMEQEKFLRKESYSDVIMNVIDGVLRRYEQRALLNNGGVKV